MPSDQVSPHVVVVGAGLAGLTAAAAVARTATPVTVLDSRSPGGRARTDERAGYLMNQGAHALYKSGPGRRVLARLGVNPTGHSPALGGSLGLADGRLVPLPINPRGFVGTDRSGPQFARMLARLAASRPSRWAGRSAREWIEDLDLRPPAAALTEALVRVATYVADIDRLPADLALVQLRSGLFRGVTYLDGGWATLVEGLAAAASSAGAVIRPGMPVGRITGEPGRWQVVTGSGEVIPATAVVVATGGPAAARGLLPVATDWGELGPEVTAACLDVGLRRSGVPFVLGLDEPLYLSPHSPPGNLAPNGGSMVHVMRYGARQASDDRPQLWHLAELDGVRDDDVVTQRFLAHMVVTHVLPPPEVGLAGRPPVAVDGAEGLFVAGDWVGSVGWLADASLASGERAGLLAAEAAARRVLSRSRVA